MRRALALSLGALLSGCGAPPAPPVAASRPPEPTAPTAPAVPGVDRSALPLPGPAVAWSPPAVTRFQLSSGLPVYYQRHGQTPLFTLLLVLKRGAGTDPGKQAGLSALTVDLLDEGAGGRTALELSDELRRLGVAYEASVDLDGSYLSMDGLAEHFEAAAALLSDIARRPALSPVEFAHRKAQRLAEALTRESEPATARSIVLRRALFGGGYGGMLPDGLGSTLKVVTLTDVKRHYAALVQPDIAALVVVGGVEEVSARQALEARFGDWRGKATAAEAKVTTEPADAGIHVVDFPGASQSVLTVAWRTEGEGTEREFDEDLYSRIMGGAFTSRINLNLREDKGYTYGARSAFQRYRGVGMFVVSANVQTPTTSASLAEITKELAGPCAGRPLTAQERDDAVQGSLLGFPGDFEQGRSIAWEYASVFLHSRPDDWLLRWSERVAGVTLSSLELTASRRCSPEGRVVVIAGDRAAVAPSLEALGHPLIVHDREGKVLQRQPVRRP